MTNCTQAERIKIKLTSTIAKSNMVKTHAHYQKNYTSKKIAIKLNSTLE